MRRRIKSTPCDHRPDLGVCIDPGPDVRECSVRGECDLGFERSGDVCGGERTCDAVGQHGEADRGRHGGAERQPGGGGQLRIGHGPDQLHGDIHLQVA